ncbi:glycine zipper family protein [Fretibacter rubidus]|uniref:glycine zipper family protein n=1 Tax=Fretibacter rubidus TaxID=570162 RepID=UPI00352ADEB9
MLRLKENYKLKMRPIALAATAAFGLSACAGSGANYNPIIDGPIGATYSADLQGCQALAKQRNYINADTKNDALIGAALGGIIGLFEPGDDAENALAGALVGGAIGGAGTAFEARGERKDIVRNCMAGRGHNVVG